VVSDGQMKQADKARLQASLGNANAQDTRLFVGQKDKKESITDYHSKATVVFQDCHDCEYTLTPLCTKVFIHSCTNLIIHSDCKIVTSALELYKCENVVIHVNRRIQNFLADLCVNVTVKFSQKGYFDYIIWAGCENLQAHVAEGETVHESSTGFSAMSLEYANLVYERSQFKLHFLKGKLVNEMIIRLENGYPTTKREKDDFDRRTEFNMNIMAKEMGVNIGRSKKEHQNIGRNDICPCGSGRKYKKCCE